jgi:hypothetical protein
MGASFPMLQRVAIVDLGSVGRRIIAPQLTTLRRFSIHTRIRPS